MLIYQIRNVVNGKVYVGQTIKPVGYRWSEHLNMLRKQKHHSAKLQCDFDLYGEENFVLEILDDSVMFDQNILNEQERHWISVKDSVSNGYNMNFGGQDGAAYFKTWDGFIDPQGNRVPPIENMAAFCREHGLKERTMRAVYYGQRHSHRNWKIEGTSPKAGFVWPKGQKHSVEHSKNQSDGLKNHWNNIVDKSERMNKLKKTYHNIVSPDGHVFETVTGLAKFCREHNIPSRGRMSELCAGKVKTYKGWTIMETQ